MLDEQKSPDGMDDLCKWLSEFDVRNRSIEADMRTWNINDAWSASPPLPYDFRVNDSDVSLGSFDPSESFKGDHFFHYESSSAHKGRRDRIARVIDLPSSEVSHLGSLRGLKYRHYPANALGNRWGNELNQHFDRFFFSTLPDPNVAQWDGASPLANGRLIAHHTIPQLTDPNAARHLLLKNGFNINSTSTSAWKAFYQARAIQPDPLSRDMKKPVQVALRSGLN